MRGRTAYSDDSLANTDSVVPYSPVPMVDELEGDMMMMSCHTLPNRMQSVAL